MPQPRHRPGIPVVWGATGALAGHPAVYAFPEGVAEEVMALCGKTHS